MAGRLRQTFYSPSPIPASPAWTRLFSIRDGRNGTTRRGRIAAGFPVLELRPRRSFLSRKANLPNDEICTSSPDDSRSEITSTTASTSRLPSGRVDSRMNEEEQGGDITSIAMPASQWTRHPKWNPLWQDSHRRPYRISDVDHDVAVAIAPTHYDRWSSLIQGAWPAHWQLNRALIELYELHEGNSALVMGFPEGGWYEGRKDWPLVRSATIAQMRPNLRENTNTFLIDGNIFPGNSGGPVVADVGAAKTVGATRYPRHRLMGMVCATSISSGGENAGLGVIVSIEKINEAIDEALRLGIPGTVDSR